MGKETDKEVEEGLLQGLGSLVFGGAVVCYLIYVHAFVGFQFYNWFIQPYWNTPEFTLIQFVGFSMTIKAFIPRGGDWIKDEYKEENRFWKILLFPWLYYLIGMLFHAIAH